MLNLSKTFETAEAVNMDEKLGLLNKQAIASVEALQKMEAYEGNDNLRKNAVALFEFYKSLSESEFKEMVEILKKKSNITVKDLTRMDELNKGIVERETVLDKNLSDAQQAFATKYGFPIEKNKLQNEIDDMNK
jgi:ATP-dependent DNA ligase